MSQRRVRKVVSRKLCPVCGRPWRRGKRFEMLWNRSIQLGPFSIRVRDINSLSKKKEWRGLKSALGATLVCCMICGRKF